MGAFVLVELTAASREARSCETKLLPCPYGGDTGATWIDAQHVAVRRSHYPPRVFVLRVENHLSDAMQSCWIRPPMRLAPT